MYPPDPRDNQYKQSSGDPSTSVATKKRKTVSEKEEAALNAQQEQEAFDHSQPFTLVTKQPWASKEVQVSAAGR